MSRPPRFVLFLAIGISVFMSGCPNHSYKRPHRVANQSDAGEFTIAVTSVQRWEHFVDKLAPTFELKPAEALAAVLPVTNVAEQRLFSNIAAGLAVSLPTSTTKSESTMSRTDSTSSETSTTTRSRGPGQVSEAPAPSPAAGEGLSALPGVPESMRSLGIDPLLQYTAATALYQEVQLLNAYVKDAAFARDKTPYVVRIQLGVIPYARRQPYDVYANIGFFAEEASTEPQGKECKPKVHDSCEPGTALDPADCDPKRTELITDCGTINLTSERGRTGEKQEAAFVVPLLVTDNLESQIASRSSEVLKQLSLSLGVLTGNLAGAGSLAKQWGELESTLGRDVNSLMTVGRQTDNSIVVRLGASQSTASEYAMVPQNHFITLLVMVSNKVAESHRGRVRVVARTALRDVEAKGHDLGVQHSETRPDLAVEAMRRHNLDANSITKAFCPRPSEPEALKECSENPIIREKFVARKLLQALFANEFDDFDAILCNAGLNRDYPRDLWMDLAGSLGSSPVAGARFELPEENLRFPDPCQSIMIIDDTKKAMTVRLMGGDDLFEGDLEATLALRMEETHDELVRFGAMKIEVGAQRRDLTLTFPSAAALKLTPSQANPQLKPGTVEGSLSLCRNRVDRFPDASKNAPAVIASSCAPDPAPTAPCTRPLIVYAKSDQKAEPPFRMWPAVEVVRADKVGNGTVRLYIEVPKQLGNPSPLIPSKIKFKFTNANVSSARFLDISRKVELGALTVPFTSGDLILNLVGLDSSIKVKIEAQALDNAGKTIEPAHPKVEIAVKQDVSRPPS